ncbi:MAG: flagellar biosynthesis protein FlhF [Ignavibacterium sp.]
MKIKKYLAPSLNEAVNQMKSELGLDAIILSTRVINQKNNNIPFKTFEIIAGIDNQIETSTIKEKNKLETFIKSDKVEEKNKSVVLQNNFDEELNNLKQKIFSQKELLINEDEDLNKKTDDLFPLTKSKVIKNNQKNFIEIEKEIKRQSDKTEEKNQDKFTTLRKVLKKREIQKSIIEHLVNDLEKHSRLLKTNNYENYLLSLISSMIPNSVTEITKEKKPKVIALVGPTGVGKTTSIAKLAIISKLINKLDVGLISIDTFRLGAIEQLKTFSNISDIDFLVAYNLNDLPKLIEKFKKKNVIFIDTVGRSQNNQKQLLEMRSFLTKIKIDETWLVLNSVSTTKALFDIADKFQVMNYNGLIFTKLDESVAFGNILNVVHKYNLPVKYLTNGQVIPDDIIAGDSDYIARLIYSGKLN